MAGLSFEQVCYRYPGHTSLALDHCTVQIPRGKRVAIIGRNGSGKSTFFLHCNGILQPTSGQVYVDGERVDYSRAAIKQLRQTVGIVFQNADDQLFSASIEQDISFGAFNLGLAENEVRVRVAQAAAQCELTHLLQRPVHALSGGQKARVALAGVLVMQPEVILVDEPTANLDPLMRQQVFRIFNQLQTEGKTIIVATHEYEIARYWAEFVVVMQGGRVVLADWCEAVFSQPTVLADIGLHEPWFKAVLDIPDK